MLQELEALFEAVPEEAPARAHRAAIVEENVLGKRTAATRKETASRLKALHSRIQDLCAFQGERQQAHRSPCSG